MMTNISLDPKGIITIYQDEECNVFLEHSVIRDGEVISTNPLSKSTTQKLFDLASSGKKSHEVQEMNRTVIAVKVSPLTIAWIYPKSTYSLLIKNETLVVDGMQLLFVFFDNALHAFFIKRNQGLSTILYDMNLPNMRSGKVCLGNYRMDTTTFERIIQTGEEGFFGTAFYDSKEGTVKELRETKAINRKRIKRLFTLKELLHA